MEWRQLKTVPMIKRFVSVVLAFLVVTLSLTACDGTARKDEGYTPKYTHAYISALAGGFVDTIGQYCLDEGITVERFRELCQLRAEDMTPEELGIMNGIRARQWTASDNVLMQKVITLYDMNKYLNGEYLTPRGSVSICADVKQYVTTSDMYYGLRLDYAGTYFTLAEDFAVVRFFAVNADIATIPLSPFNGGDCTDPYPFGGVGFTTGTNGVWGSPEWKFSVFTVLVDGAEIFQVDGRGRETLVGVYVAESGRFVPVGDL
jgi:hypothetical protein